MQIKQGLRRSHFVMLFIIGITLLIVGCKNTQRVSVGSGAAEKGQNAGINDHHNSRNALDWAGVYSGKLPCADCMEIQAVLDLHADGTYLLKYKYEGKSDSSYTWKGTFQWDPTGSKISLKILGDTPVTYRVVENGLEQLDQNGRPVKGRLASYSRFTKMEGYSIKEKYWKLTQINGQPIQYTGEKEPHMILKADSSVRGFAGCNGFGGHFELSPGNRIHFSRMVSTRMACPDLAIENAFMKLLENADNYSQHGDTLYLNKAKMAPLAQFVAVYFN